MKLLVKGGQVIDPANGINQNADLLIEKGKIAAIGASLTVDRETEVIDATGKIVTPGLIDMHVHLREPGFEAKETIKTGTRAAAMGGFTSVACMPNTKPVVDNQAVVEFIKARAAQNGLVNVYPIGAITKGSGGEELAEIADLKAAGAVALSDDGRPVMNAEVMRRALEYVKMFDLPIICHCEDLHLSAEGVMNEGYWSMVLGLKGIPNAAEEVMVARDLILSEMTGTPVHIAHVSTAGSVRLIREAKQRGVKVTAEVTPHHLTLTDEIVKNFDTYTKVNPPLRTPSDIAALKQGLVDGTIDVIATDHAPHTLEEKDGEYTFASFGIVGLETAVPLIWWELVEREKMPLETVVAKLTINPARILGLPKGTLSVGADADITVIDPRLELVVDIDKFESKGKNSPYNGWLLRGWPVITIVGGRVVMKDRRIVEQHQQG
ncbi:MAG: dihydroorotase [Firmicutes bacterium]|nr:dihydroorotase [Bacillota bacterium]